LPRPQSRQLRLPQRQSGDCGRRTPNPSYQPVVRFSHRDDLVSI